MLFVDTVALAQKTFEACRQPRIAIVADMIAFQQLKAAAGDITEAVCFLQDDIEYRREVTFRTC